MKTEIVNGTIEEAVAIQNQIPEFKNAYALKEYQKRLAKKPHLILIARQDEQSVGFKVGYEENSKVFYSWMGGILPEFRKKHFARLLAEHQQLWAIENGYKMIRFKTRNYLKPMLIFALKNGFYIKKVIKKDYTPDNYRVVLEKSLLNG